MKLAMIAGGLLLCAGCATTPEVTLLMGPRVDNQQDTTDFGVTVMILQQIGNSRFRCGHVHSSTLENGPPWRGERFEVTVDGSGCGPRWGGKPRQ